MEQRVATAVEQPDGTLSAPSVERDVARFVLLLRRYWRVVVSVVVAGTLAAAVVAFVLPNEYASTVNAVPPKRPQGVGESILGNLSSVLRDVGLMRVGSARAAAQGYDLMAILQSRSLLDSLIERFDLIHSYDIPTDISRDSALYLARKELSDRYEVDFDAAGNYRITIIDRDRFRAAAMANAVVEIANNIARSLDQQESATLLNQVQARLESALGRMNAIADSLAAVSKKSLMFAPLEQAQAAAQALAEVRAQLTVQEILLSVYRERYGESDPLTQQQQRIVESLQQKVADMERRPGFVGNFSLTDAPRAAYEYMRYYTELETMMKLKAAMLPTLEELKTSLSRYSPVLYVVDRAIPAVKKHRPMRSLIIAGGFVASCVIAVVLAFVLDQIATLRRQLRVLAGSQ